MDTSREPESFRSQLLRHRGRTGLTQRDLASRAGVSLRSVQDWEAGVTLPSAERLRALLRALLQVRGLTPGQESAEARELWTAVAREAPRMQTPFDEEWFAGLLGAGEGRVERAQDWGDVPDTTQFVGRADELDLLKHWVLEEHCRMVTVLGIGGIGKTSLAAKLAQIVAPNFERVYWRSLRNAPPVSEWLAGAIGFLSDRQVVLPLSEPECINTVLQLLRARRCLLVLDNSETLFEPGQQQTRYRPETDGYGQLLHHIGAVSHRSCLVLTSREALPELALSTGVRELELHGLGVHEVQALLADKQLDGDTQTWISLVDRYGGNGLALKIVGETIRQIYDGDVAGFLRDASVTYGTVFGGIRRLLDVQTERLSAMERDLLRQLAIEREPIGVAELSADITLRASRNTVIEAIENLRRRSLIERGERGATFSLQSMVLEYMTDRLVETVDAEIGDQPTLLLEQPLIKAQAKDYVRQTQERLIGMPILERLTAQYGQGGSESRLLALLDSWRGRSAAEQGYGPGNVVNLLRLLRGDLKGMNLSRLALRQVYLQGVDTQDASLAQADLTGAVLDEAFPYATAVALSADGAFLVAGTPTGEVRLWQTADRTLLLALQGHTGVVWGVALSADGKLLASSGADGTVRLWDAASGQLLTTLQGHTGVVLSVALSSDGRLVASGGDDATVRLWDAQSGELRFALHGHTGGVRGMAISGDGRLLASGSVDGTIRLWEAESGQVLASLLGHTGPVMSMALSGDAQLVASGGADGVVRLWSFDRFMTHPEARQVSEPSGQLLATLKGHTGAVLSVALSGDGGLAASGGADAMVKLWQTGSGQLLATLHGHTGVVLSVALSTDGHLAASASWDGTVRLWSASNGQLLATLQGHTGMVMSVAVSGDGRTIVSGGLDGTLRAWEADRAHLLAMLQGHTGVVYGVRLSEDGQLVASAGFDGTVRLWETGTGQLLATLWGHAGAVWCVALSGDGRLIASGGVDGTVRLWSLRGVAGRGGMPGIQEEAEIHASRGEGFAGHLLATLHGHTGLVWGVALSADGRLVVSGGVDGKVRLWEAGTGQLLTTFEGHAGVVLSVALSADGELVASSGADGTVRLWDTRSAVQGCGSGEPLASLQGHSGAALSVSLSADGRLVASGGADGMARLWDAKRGQILATLQGHTGVVSTVALSADGRLVATGGDDGTVRLWDAATGASRSTLRADRHYERLDITGLTGVTQVQRAALLALGAVETSV